MGLARTNRKTHSLTQEGLQLRVLHSLFSVSGLCILEKNDVRFREFRRFDVRFSIRDSVSIPFLVPETIAGAQVSQHRTERRGSGRVPRVKRTLYYPRRASRRRFQRRLPPQKRPPEQPMSHLSARNAGVDAHVDVHVDAHVIASTMS